MQSRCSEGTSASPLISIRNSSCWVYSLPQFLLAVLLVQSWSLVSKASSDAQQAPGSDPLIPRRLTDLSDATISLEMAARLPESEGTAVLPNRDDITGVVRSITTPQSEPKPATDNEAVPKGVPHQHDIEPAAMRQTLSSHDAAPELNTEDRVSRLRAQFEHSRHPWVSDPCTSRKFLSENCDCMLWQCTPLVHLPCATHACPPSEVFLNRDGASLGVQTKYNVAHGTPSSAMVDYADVQICLWHAGV